MNLDKEILNKNKFIVVTEDMSGLGFARILETDQTGRGFPREQAKNEVILGYFPVKESEKDKEKEYLKTGDGIVNKIEFSELWKNKEKYKSWIWIWDGNHHSKEADQLRADGFKVFAGHGLADKMEHDRNFGMSLIKKAGLSYPPYKEFKTIDEGLNFLDENEDIAYVFKPDDGVFGTSWTTTAPDNDNDIKANEEMYKFLESQEEKGSYILQERKKGIELNTEVWIYKGQPFFAFGNFELKKKDTGEMGVMIGCAGDIDFLVPLDARILKETLYKLIALPEFKNYTGFVDMNMIVADREFYFLEFCARFGYNSHPNLFLNLALDPMSEIISDFVNGRTDDFYRHFRPGFGASLTIWHDNPTMGVPLIFEDERENESRFYHFGTYKDGEDWFISGFGNEIGIAMAHDFDLKSAAEACLDRAGKIHFPGKRYRTDLGKHDYFNNPVERLEACEALKLFDKT